MAGAYNKEQVYSYAFDSNKSLEKDGYEIREVSIYAGGEKVEPKEEVGKEGTFTLTEEQQLLALRGLTVQVDVKKLGGGVLDGDEALSLTVDNVASPDQISGDAPSGKAEIKNFNECAIDGVVKEVLAVGACVEDGAADKASFAFNVVMAGAYNKEQVYSYAFDSNKSLEKDGYEIREVSIYAGGEKVEPKEEVGKEGTFTLTEEQQLLALRGLTVQVDVKKLGGGVLDGDEALSLTVDNVASPDQISGDAPSGEAKIGNFENCEPAPPPPPPVEALR